MLTAIKLVHTLVWAFMVGCILAIPIMGVLRRFRRAAILSAIVWLECLVLVINGWRCPLTDLAERYTIDRGPAFDIYLPPWLAQHNKTIFGLTFLAGELLVLGLWLRERGLRRKRSVGSQ
jgi:hypothetical protein